MKRRLLLTALLFSSAVCFAGKINPKVYFGKQPSCTGSGICTITTTTHSSPGGVSAELDLDASGTGLRLIISDTDAATLSQEIQDNLANNVFVMEDGYTLPDDVINALGTGENITIPAGEYLVTHTGTEYIISF